MSSGDNLRGSNNPRWNGNRTQKRGYPCIFYPDHPRSDPDGYILEHIDIAEKATGILIISPIEVHHANGIKDKNENNNLVICQDRQYHSVLHQRMKAFQACGIPYWRKCKHCKEYDDPKNLYINGRNSLHRECRNAYDRNRRASITI